MLQKTYLQHIYFIFATQCFRMHICYIFALYLQHNASECIFASSSLYICYTMFQKTYLQHIYFIFATQCFRMHICFIFALYLQHTASECIFASSLIYICSHCFRMHICFIFKFYLLTLLQNAYLLHLQFIFDHTAYLLQFIFNLYLLLIFSLANLDFCM